MKREIYFAGGCFWGTEHFFKLMEGVTETQVGYANGTLENPTYEQVCTHTTGHAETVRVQYDPEKIGLEFLLDMFFKAIDPTLNFTTEPPRKPLHSHSPSHFMDEALRE